MASFIRPIRFCPESGDRGFRQIQKNPMKMKCRLIITLIVAVAFPLFGAESGNGWKLAKQTNGVAIYSRPHPGSYLKEFKAIGEIDARSTTVHSVIDDVESYSSFMP